MDDAKVLVLNKEQILVFRGDLVYAGVDFNDENVRLHCCALIKSIEQKEDTPEVDALARYLCETCLLMSESRRHLANHILTVKSVGSRDEKEDDEGAANNKGATRESRGAVQDSKATGRGKQR
ncbi:hypothetical protein F441_00272 [Phytophthora nicotianae CJ01A1]|uniref:Uncharacterized protein n=1 Tax=Phytophthora nicotianae CJ01A1 TaxID=1317063 RepID=W2XXU6_PHYNI|nr:hypothetical protein F441_00272 [Phytophthora nicotianae CJ01A1]